MELIAILHRNDLGNNRQTLKFMKLITFFILVACLQVSGKSLAQNVTINERNVPLKAIFNKIHQQTGYSFFYRDEWLAHAKRVSVQVKNKPLSDVLDLCFEGQPLIYELMGNTILVKIKPREATSTASLFDKPEFVYQTIQGSVVTKEGQPLEGVSIVKKGTNQGTTTNTSGNFTIEANPGDVLIFTRVGYRSVNKTIGTSTSIRVTMEVEETAGDEVVVVGYGTTIKKDLTGSVSIIKPKDIQDIPFLTIDNSLAGKAAGVQVTKTDGSPGGAVRIRVRGSTSLLGGNDPLYVIDGVPLQVKSNYINPGFDVSSPVGNDIKGSSGVAAGLSAAFVNGLNSIGWLNIDDIESITILKDASSKAIYGSKAANGVVIINTKLGKKDMKPEILFSYYTTYSKPLLPTLLNGDQYRMLLSEAAKNAYNYRMATGKPISLELSSIVNSPDSYFGKANTNWLNEVTRSVFSNNAEISVRGGGSASKYYTSISYNKSPGVIRNSHYERISGKLNLVNEIGKHLRFITNLNMGYTNQDITNGAYQQALRARPDYTPYDSTGSFTSFAKIGSSYMGYENPVARLTAINNSKTFNLLGSLSAIYEFSPSLHLKSTLSLSMQNYDQRNYLPSYLTIGSFYGNINSNGGGIGSNSTSKLTNWFEETQLTWNKDFNEKHSLNLMAGYSYETKKSSFFSATAQGYPNDNILTSLSSAVTPLLTKGDNPSKPQSYLVSYYLRVNYAFKDKYLVTFTGRADGSSKFGPENKFGYFPSAAIAWRMSKENFMKNITWIDDIKLRASYGVTGTQNIDDQMYRTLYSPFSYAGSSALIPTQLGNAGIKWETTDETDLGLDFSFLNRRVMGTIDYYRKQTNGALLSLPVNPSSSYTSFLGNVADIRSTGLEVSLQGDIIRTRNFRWNASFNITSPKTLVTKLSKDADLNQLGNLSGLESGNVGLVEGQPLGLILGIKVNGIINNQKQLDDYKQQLGGWAGIVFGSLSIGDPMFQLVTRFDGLGHYVAFKQVIGNAAPKYYGGFTQQFSYKNYDFSFYFTFSQGGQLMWGDHASSINFLSTANANAIALKRWTPENPNSTQPRLLFMDQRLLYNTNLSVFNSSYIKLRTVTFNYRLPTHVWMKKTGIHNASVFLSATNLFTITKYPGNDPETSNDPFSVAGGYFDVSTYPSVRTFSAGLKVGF